MYGVVVLPLIYLFINILRLLILKSFRTAVIGNNTLTILTWHFLCFKIVSLIITFAEQLPVGQLADFPVISDYSRQGWFVMYFIVGLFLPLQFAKIKYLR